MDTDDGIYYIPFTPKTLKNYLLEMLKKWICSDKCHYKIDEKNDGNIYIDDGNIMIVSVNNPDEEVKVLFTKEELSFITMICDTIIEYYNSHQVILKHNDKIMSTKEFEWKSLIDPDFDFRDDFIKLWQLTHDINEVWDKKYIWMYWDTGCDYNVSPFIDFDEIRKIFNHYIYDDVFEKIFNNYKDFSEFIDCIPMPECIEI